MKIEELVKMVDAKLICGESKLNNEIKVAFASDLMSDVLRVDKNNILLVTGLANLQTIRTAEMADITYILFVRGKKASPEMIEIAEENGMLIMESEYSMFRCSGLLFQAGIKPIF